MAGILRGWTIQPWAVWEQVHSGRTVTVDWRYSAGLHYGYDWLREQLARRVTGYAGHYPWWAYDVRPDLRRHRHHQPLGEAFALLELSLPTARTVTLPFWAWDRIFDCEYVAVDRREAADWERRLREAFPGERPWPLPEPWRTELHASWERIFAPGFPDRRPAWVHGDQERTAARSMEYVFEVLERPMVASVTRHMGTRKGATRRDPCPAAEWLDGPSRMHLE